MDGLGLFPKKSGNEEEKDVGGGGGSAKGSFLSSGSLSTRIEAGVAS